MNKQIFISNAFSLQMIPNELLEKGVNISVNEISKEEFKFIKDKAVSVVGHEDTARVLGVKFNRANLTLGKDNVLIVAQLIEGRLPEGATTLPIGFSFKFLRVEII